MAETNIQPLAIVERIFSNWTALRMAIEHGMGTNTQARNFCEYVAEFLQMNDQLHHTDVAAELDDYMDGEFNTKLEDDSEKQVAEEIVRFHRYIIKKDLESLQTEFAKLPSLQLWIVNQGFKAPRAVNKTDSTSESDGDTDSEDMDSGDDNDKKKKSTGQMEVDEEGWSVVRKKR